MYQLNYLLDILRKCLPHNLDQNLLEIIFSFIEENPYSRVLIQAESYSKIFSPLNLCLIMHNFHEHFEMFYCVRRDYNSFSDVLHGLNRPLNWNTFANYDIVKILSDFNTALDIHRLYGDRIPFQQLILSHINYLLLCLKNRVAIKPWRLKLSLWWLYVEARLKIVGHSYIYKVKRRSLYSYRFP